MDPPLTFPPDVVSIVPFTIKGMFGICKLPARTIPLAVTELALPIVKFPKVKLVPEVPSIAVAAMGFTVTGEEPALIVKLK
jgi:hypothetical protein